MRLRVPIQLIFGVIPALVAGQATDRAWYVGAETQFSAPLLPASSVGVFAQYSFLHSRRFAFSINGIGAVALSNGARVACTQSTICDSRLVNRFAIGTGRASYAMLTGVAGPEVGAFVGAGAYASSFDSDGTYASGSGPSGSALEAGFQVASSRASPVLFELAVRRLARVGRIDNTALALRLGLRW